MNLHRFVFCTGLLLLGGILALIIRNYNRDPKSHIHIDDLLLGEDGRLSKTAFVLVGSFFVTSSIVLYQTVLDKLTETMFGLYCATWVGPTLTAALKRPGAPVTNISNTSISADVANVKAPQPTEIHI